MAKKCYLQASTSDEDPVVEDSNDIIFVKNINLLILKKKLIYKI